jgi:hypothetical protein
MGPVAQTDGGYVASALPRPQLDQIGRDPASAHEKTADRNRQSEAARTSLVKLDSKYIAEVTRSSAAFGVEARPLLGADRRY